MVTETHQQEVEVSVDVGFGWLLQQSW
jgi:hypothetical protein